MLQKLVQSVMFVHGPVSITAPQDPEANDPLSIVAIVNISVGMNI
jgi:hypothetical protein